MSSLPVSEAKPSSRVPCVSVMFHARCGAEYGTDIISMYRNDGGGFFTRIVLRSVVSPYFVKIVDVNRDGRLDVLYTVYSTNGWVRCVSPLVECGRGSL
jgi:hypothetical protein